MKAHIIETPEMAKARQEKYKKEFSDLVDLVKPEPKEPPSHKGTYSADIVQPPKGNIYYEKD